MMDTSLEYPVDNRVMDGEDQMLRDELAAISAKRDAARKLHENLYHPQPGEGPYTVGLALSGGGIRSATVSLGVMQKLAGAGLLKHVDYLSTVSGGGYIGSAVTWWLRGNARNEPPNESMYDTGDRFPFGTNDPRLPDPSADAGPGGARQLTPLEFLRVQGNYLAPGNGLTVWSAVAVVARAILLNLMIWIPVAALVIGVIYALGQLPFLKGLPFAVRMAAPGALETAADIVGSSGQVEVNQTVPPAFLLMLVLAIALSVLFIAGSVVHSLLSWTNLKESAAAPRPDDAEPPAERAKWYSWLLAGFLALIGLVLLVATVLWVHPAIETLFAQTDVGTQRAMPGLLQAGILLIILVIGTVIAFVVMGRRNLKMALKGENQTAVAMTLLGLFVLLALGYLADQFVPAGGSFWARLPELLLFVFAVSYLLFAVYLIGLLVRHVLRAQAVGDPQAVMQVPTLALLEYRARRVFEWFYGRTLFWIIVLVLIGSLPLVSGYITYGLSGVWTALGLGVTLAGNLASRVRGDSRLTEITIIIGAALFAYGILLVGHHLALSFMNGDVTARALIAAAVVVALVAGWFVNTNHIGLHRFYRDRLMEAFLPDAASLRGDVNAAATAANERQLVDCWNEAWAKGPYQIVNTCVVLANSPQRKYRLRGGDNFILTPEFIGSSAIGWYPTRETANSDMTLASAMAISGAAANPRGAASGRGPTRSPFVSLVMSLLNIRLGYWIPNPLHGVPRLMLRRPNHFWPGGAYAATRGGYTETARWLEIADGGHFENLAIYELVRRRCGLIVVCDGGQDVASSYRDLVASVQRIGQDFGATVTFDMQVKNGGGFDASGLAQMIADPKLTDYPKGAEFAEKGYVVGRIDYGARGGNGWPESGILIYMKSALIRSLAISAKGY
ncbi:MAG: patatin-like phospholipase family protein, partial [Parvibaculaceae bacterium]